jgi:anhydro-N-acetylmuramic acid kinase
MACFIGLMSGTSLDGIDGVLAEQSASDGRLSSLAHVHHPLHSALRAELLALNHSDADELHRAALACNRLADAYAEVVAELLGTPGLVGSAVRAIGAHGQTVRHSPREPASLGYTLQLMNGARLAERTGLDVVCDFRSRDVAAGGEGAPLVPAFHAAQFARPGRERCVLNIGGIANLTLLGRDGAVRGFDTGPGNVLMDLWCARHLGRPYDAGGAWSASGQVLPDLLASLLTEPYFQRQPPKSTGRDLFNAEWLDLPLRSRADAPADVMATLTELTATSVVQAMRQQAPDIEELIVCGGGAYNRALLARLADQSGSGVSLSTSDPYGVPPDQVEALAFAWLAAAFVARQPGNVPAVTGARGPRVLGALYPA